MGKSTLLVHTLPAKNMKKKKLAGVYLSMLSEILV